MYVWHLKLRKFGFINVLHSGLQKHELHGKLVKFPGGGGGISAKKWSDKLEKSKFTLYPTDTPIDTSLYQPLYAETPILLVPNCSTAWATFEKKNHSTHYFNTYPYYTDSYNFLCHFVSIQFHTIFHFSTAPTPPFHIKLFSGMLFQLLLPPPPLEVPSTGGTGDVWFKIAVRPFAVYSMVGGSQQVFVPCRWKKNFRSQIFEPTCASCTVGSYASLSVCLWQKSD